MVMPCQHLEDAVCGRMPILASDPANPVRHSQIQTASIDLRLGTVAYAMWSAALPHGEAVTELIARFQQYSFDLHPEKTNVLEKGKTYLVPLMESCQFPDGIFAHFSPKSSTGRCDVFIRVIGDRHPRYDRTRPGYRGPLYAEITPLSFNVSVRAGLELTQARIRTPKTETLDREAITLLHSKEGIAFGANGEPLDYGKLRIEDDCVFLHVDLQRDVVGFSASDTVTRNLDLTKGGHNPREFWHPVPRPANGQLVLVPGKFYLLATKERMRIPSACCGEILPLELTTGEFRPHYAGFFDNGFGGDHGTNGVLELRIRDVPFRVVDGQPICAMRFEKTSETPARLYSGNYRKAGPSLSKHFADRYEAWLPEFWRRFP